MIFAGDVFHVSLKGVDRSFIILTSPDQDDSKVLFIMEEDVTDVFAESASDIEKIAYGNGCPNCWYSGEHLTDDSLRSLQNGVLDADVGEYFKKHIHKYRAKAC